MTGGPHNWNGCNPSCYDNHPWNSIDLVPSDHHVFAARAGFVHTNDCSTPGFVRIDHGDGYQTTYMHLDPNSILVHDGDYVYRGQQIGDIGISHPCNAPPPTAAHVHFSIWLVPVGQQFHFTGAIDWDQVQLGAWYLSDAVKMYDGCITPLTGGASLCVPNAGTIQNDWPSEQIPVARHPTGLSEDVLMRGSTIHGFQTQTDNNGMPLGWHDLDLGGLFKGSPTAAYDSTMSRLDVFGVATDGLVYHLAWTSSGGWGSSWAPVPTQAGLGVSGTSETETVNVDREPNGQLDLFIRGVSGDAQHALLASSGTLYYWESLGGAVKGAPTGRWNNAGTQLEVFAIGTDDHPHRITWDYSWGGWTSALQGTAATAGTEMVMAVRKPADDSIELLFRGTANDAVHEHFNSAGGFVYSESLGGTVKGAPDGEWDAQTARLVVFAIGTTDVAWERTSATGVAPWGPWTQLTGGAIWG